MFPSNVFPPSCRTTKLFITVLAGMRLLFCVLTIHMVPKGGWCDGCKVTMITLVGFLSCVSAYVIPHVACNFSGIVTVNTLWIYFPLVFGFLTLANIFLFSVSFHRFQTIGICNFPWSLVFGINCFFLFNLLFRTLLIFYENLLTLLCRLLIVCVKNSCFFTIHIVRNKLSFHHGIPFIPIGFY